MKTVTFTKEQVIEILGSVNDRIEALYDHFEWPDNEDLVIQHETLEDIMDLLYIEE